MTITNGKYRGTEITISLVPESSGQIQCLIEIGSPYLKAHFDVVKDEEIRKAFNLPDKDNESCYFHNLFKAEKNEEKHNAIFWNFMFNCLRGPSTQYEFLGSVFRGIDKIIEIILQRCPYPKCSFDIECNNPKVTDKDLDAIRTKLNEFAGKWQWPYKFNAYETHLGVLMALKSDELTDHIVVNEITTEDGTHNYKVIIWAVEANRRDGRDPSLPAPSVRLPGCYPTIKCTNDAELDKLGGEAKLFDAVAEEVRSKLKWPYENANTAIMEAVEKFLGDHNDDWDKGVVSTGVGEYGTYTYQIGLVFRKDQQPPAEAVEK